MKETMGRIVSWDEVSQKGLIKGDSGDRYPFGSKEWIDEEKPEVGGEVLVICQNGRDASHVEYIGIEHIPTLKITTHSEQGAIKTFSYSRFIGGPRRMRSDALVWMAVSRGLHAQNAHVEISDIRDLAIGEHPLISLRGSVIKYCYGFAFELYIKWILVEAKVEYNKNHSLRDLIKKLPSPVLDKLREIYLNYRDQYTPQLKMMEAHFHGVSELELDWSTFDNFMENLEKEKFIIARYADPTHYSIFKSLSSKMSREMNTYMDSDDFFDLGDRLLAYVPSLSDYSL